MTYQLKLQILKHMRLVPLHSAWGFAARDFVENMDTKTDQDYEVLLYELCSDIQDGPITMREVLGPTFHFFHELVL
ncbi:MAG: hypothetical protein INR73_01055 [Williamsia sp.]|nr:hypothetical protein [Williamsia sp.]